MLRRVTGYSAGSVVAIVISEAAFAAALGWGHTGTTVASAIGFLGGAVPNYILNRRWAWRDRRGRDRRTEVLLYMVVALATFVVSALVTHWAESAARAPDGGSWMAGGADDRSLPGCVRRVLRFEVRDLRNGRVYPSAGGPRDRHSRRTRSPRVPRHGRRLGQPRAEKATPLQLRC